MKISSPLINVEIYTQQAHQLGRETRLSACACTHTHTHDTHTLAHGNRWFCHITYLLCSPFIAFLVCHLTLSFTVITKKTNSRFSSSVSLHKYSRLFPLCSLFNQAGKLLKASCFLLLLLQVIDSIKAGMLEEFIMLISVEQVVGMEVLRSGSEIDRKKLKTNLSHFFTGRCLDEFCLGL